ncbi:MAG TPA: protein kinase [Polyangiaceae bacterium]|jgi:serine/threonine-protein kinase
MSSSTDSQPPPVSGLVAGKYEVIRLIGRGGMGSVWEGRHASLGTGVAIKFIDQEYADSKEARSRFDTEARAAATLQSKHAIQIYDHGVTDDGRPYMVMELLHGEPLDKRIDRLGRLSLQETARILTQCCRALQRAHDGGIIHRDLKPENIFLVRSHDDDDEIAKVLDFGIAKIKTPPDGQGLTSSTKTGAVLGTPYYMSPEQARGLRSIDVRSDLWSLGVIAYKCVTGVLPFEGESVGDLLVKICTAPLPTPSLTMPGLPQSFDAWFARTMEREPARRYRNATELADALAFSAGISVRRGPTSSNPDGARSMGGGPPITPYTPGPPAQTPLPAAGLTSAPFVTSASPPRSSRGVMFAVVAAALVGGSVGVFAVVKLLAPSRSAAGHAVAPALTAPTAVSVNSAGVVVTGPGVTVTVPTASTAADPTPPAPSVAVTSLPTVPPRGRPGWSRPGPTPAPPAPAPTKTPVKPPPPSSDPGY